jgi:hypothetical protein
MQNGTHTERRTRSRRALPLALVTLVAGVLMAGCGAGSSSTTAAAVAGASTSLSNIAPARSATANSSSSPSDVAREALAFAKCMRANGVRNFPDPQPGRGFLFSTSGLNLGAPAARAAQVKCQKLMGGGPPGPGSTTHPSAQTVAKLVRIADCMRRHGVPDFPDPRTTVPLDPFPSGAGVITDYDGAILLFPSTLDMHSPAYLRATSACGVLAGKLGRGPHS